LPSRFKRLLVLGRLALVGLIPSLLIPATSAAVTISLVPDRPPTIAVGETVNVDVFIVLDAADQAVGISALAFHLEGGSAFVSVGGSRAVSPFPTANFIRVTLPNDYITFSHFGTTVTTPQVKLATLAITGVNPGTYDLVARRFGNFPLITSPPEQVDNRYDFSSDETLTITIVPEPSSWLLLSLGIAGMVMIRRKVASRA